MRMGDVRRGTVGDSLQRRLLRSPPGNVPTHAMMPIEDPDREPFSRGEDPSAHLATVRELILAAQKGDRRAAEELFRIHEPAVVGWVSRRLGLRLRSLDDTRDVLHDAYASCSRGSRTSTPTTPRTSVVG
jgi:hypothetical protein